MRIAVTGGAGFMGTRVVEALVDRGIEVIAIDAPEARHDRLVDGARYLWGDLRDPDLSIVACAGVDAVCHLASRTGSDVFDRVPAFVADNDVATAALLHSLHLQDFEGRLVLGSSADVYGEGTYECAEHGPVRPQRRRRADLERRRWDPACPSCGEPLAHRATTEAERTDPLTVFAATKLHQEHLFENYGAHHAETVVTRLRYQNVYGSGIPIGPDADGVFALFRRDIASGQRPQVFEDGAQRRDFVHVDDAVRATLLALLDERGHHGALNIASGRATTVLQLATAMCAALETHLWPELAGQFRVGDVRHLVLDPHLAHDALGFRPETTLADGMARSFRSPTS